MNNKNEELIQEILKIPNIKYKDGISEKKLKYFELKLSIIIPQELKNILMEIVPVSDGFYDWSDTSNNNIEYMKSLIIATKKNIIDNYDDIYWSENLLELHLDSNKEKFEKCLLKAPNLVPLNGHRYMISGVNDGPILSVADTDIIYYGVNLKNYVKREFFKKNSTGIEYNLIKNKIEFWSDMAEV